jgi:hypothetical protein
VHDRRDRVHYVVRALGGSARSNPRPGPLPQGAQRRRGPRFSAAYPLIMPAVINYLLFYFASSPKS